MLVELGGVVFDGEASTGWGLVELIDWSSVPDSKSPNDSVPQGHGSFDPGIDWRSAAVPSFKARYVGYSRPEALEAVEEFNRVGMSPDIQTMTVTDELRTTSRQVSVRNVAVTDPGYAPWIDIEVDCLAWDPLRYGEEVSESTGLPSLAGGIAFPIVFPIDFATTGTPGRITLPNTGTQATRPRFSVAGGLAGGFSLRCIETGEEIRFEFPIAASDVVHVDAKTGRAWINSEDNSVTGYLTKSEWFDVPPGVTRTIQFTGLGATSGTPQLTGYVSPAYL